MNKEVKATANTLGAVAKQYGIDLPTLNGWIDTNETLKEELKPFRDGKKLLYPPAIIDRIYKTFGTP